MWLWHKKQSNDKKGNDKKDEAKGKTGSGNATLADHIRVCTEAEQALANGGRR